MAPWPLPKVPENVLEPGGDERTNVPVPSFVNPCVPAIGLLIVAVAPVPAVSSRTEIVAVPVGLLSVSVLLAGDPGARIHPAGDPGVGVVSPKTIEPTVRLPSSVTVDVVVILSVPKLATLPAPPATGPAPLFQFCKTPQLPDASPPAFFVHTCARATSGAEATAAATQILIAPNPQTRKHFRPF
jgi:hypothetical protein